jgi:hypothetical protein
MNTQLSQVENLGSRVFAAFLQKAKLFFFFFIKSENFQMAPLKSQEDVFCSMSRQWRRTMAFRVFCKD